MPTQVLTGDVYTVTQGAGVAAVNDSLVANLSAQPWASLVSPEILSLTSLDGEPVVVRGVEPDRFLRMDAGTWLQGGPGNGSWAAVGSGLASRLRLAVGAYLTLTGSSAPRLAIVPVTGTFRAATPSNDEVLVPLSVSRFLTGVATGSYYSVRVKTTDVPALLAFLGRYGSSVQVTAPVGAPSSPSARLVNLFLLYGPEQLPPSFLVEGLAEATNAIQVAALGLAVLVVLLLALGIHAVQARAFADRRDRVGVLRALGASRTWLLRRAAAEILPLAGGAALGGAAAGFLLSGLLWSSAGILAFGHTVRATFDPVLFALLVLAALATSVASYTLLLASALRDRPGEALREAPSTEEPVSLEVVLRG